jgi:hypothetical protein
MYCLFGIVILSENLLIIICLYAFVFFYLSSMDREQKKSLLTFNKPMVFKTDLTVSDNNKVKYDVLNILYYDSCKKTMKIKMVLKKIKKNYKKSFVKRGLERLGLIKQDDYDCVNYC